MKKIRTFLGKAKNFVLKGENKIKKEE